MNLPSLSAHLNEYVNKFGINNLKLKALYEGILGKSCCINCTLRFFGFKNDEWYFHDEKELKSWFHNHFEAIQPESEEPAQENGQEPKGGKKVPSNPVLFDTKNLVCQFCLGLLQPKVYAQYAQEIFDGIKTKDYDLESVSVNIRLPTAGLVRDKLGGFFVRELLGITVGSEQDERKLTDVNIPGIKQQLRSLIGLTLERNHGLPYDPNSAPLKVTISLEHSETHEEHQFLHQPNRMDQVDRKSGYKSKWHQTNNSRAKISANLEVLSYSSARIMTLIAPKEVTTCPIIVEVEFLRDSIFLAGRYNKNERNVSQTPWVVNGRLLAEFSVSEIIAEKCKQLFLADNTNFVPSGREDADVRMLGSGRPYSLEIISPKKVKVDDEILEKLTKEVNSNRPNLVTTTQLIHINKEILKYIKEGEENKVKFYRALVWVANPIESVEVLNKLTNTFPHGKFDILQNTPLRVLHRRSPLIRTKAIHQLGIKYLAPHFLVVDIQAEAGTYIKEFVHGDLGRTQPNLAGLLNQHRADLLELDVVHIDLAWPPQM